MAFSANGHIGAQELSRRVGSEGPGRVTRAKYAQRGSEAVTVVLFNGQPLAHFEPKEVP